MLPILIDTNVLIYAYDPQDLARSERAQGILQRLEETGSGRLSVQCLAEFFSVAIRKLKPPLTPSQAYAQVELLALAYPVLELTLPIVREAARGVRDHQLSYFDAQLWALAKLNQIPIVFTEDFPSAPALEGVRFVNPFTAEFAIDDWA